MHRNASRRSQNVPQFDASRAWMVALLFFGIGDVLTTGVGLRIGGVSEANPIAAFLFQHSILLGMIGLKIVSFGVLYALWKWTPRPYSIGVPFGLALLGIAVTAWNSRVVLLALLQ